MPKIPIHIDLTNKPCLIIGGGKVAYRKLKKLLNYGAVVTIIAPDFYKDFSEFIGHPCVNLIKKKYAKNEVAAYYFVIIATNNTALNTSIAKEAVNHRILYNIVDRTDENGVLMPASLTKCGITASVATGGQSPKLSQYLLNRFSEIIDEIPEHALQEIGEKRRQAIKNELNDDDKLAIINQDTQQLIETLKKARESTILTQTGIKNKIIRVGSRRSDLALYQTHHIINKLKQNYPDYQFEVVEFVTKGDKILDKEFKDIGGKGLFIKELQDAMICGDIDFAVHSYKDMPTELTGATKIVAVDERALPFDALVMPVGQNSLRDLPHNPVIGTSSIRRAVQIKKIHPQAQIKMLRGNVPTRVSKLDSGEYDAILLAAAGLIRLGLENRISVQFTADQMIPAVAQGAIVVEAPKNTKYQAMFDSIHHEPTAIATSVERLFLSEIGGSCTDPIGAYATLDGDRLTLIAMLGNVDTLHYTYEKMSGKLSDAQSIVKKQAENLKRKLDVYGK